MDNLTNKKRLALAAQKRLPGPVIPAWTRTLTNLLPGRIEFDALAYMLKGARQYGTFYAIWIGDKPIYVVSDPTLVREILVERATEFHKADLVKGAVGSFAGNGLFTNLVPFVYDRKMARSSSHPRTLRHHRGDHCGTSALRRRHRRSALHVAGRTRRRGTAGE
jgi:hypothetical protein